MVLKNLEIKQKYGIFSLKKHFFVAMPCNALPATIEEEYKRKVFSLLEWVITNMS